jgi:hypothetical protein
MKYNYLSTGTILALLAAQPAAADVTIEQTLDVTAPGALSLAAMEGKSRTAIAGDKSRTDNDLKFKSGLMQRFGGDAGQSTEIVRLDEGLIYHVNHKEREYQTTTFDAMKAQTEQAVEQLEQSGGGTDAGDPGAQTELPVSEDQCEWSETVVDVDRTGERQRIAGIEAEQTRVTATRTCRDRETGKACDLTWTMENWLAPDVPGSAETTEFWQAYASKLGLEDLVGNPGTPGMAALFSQYEAGWDEIEASADELEGYPLRTVMALDIGGEECTTSAGEPLSADAVFGDAMGDAAAQGVGESVGGSVGGALAKGLLGAFGKKKEKPEAAPPESAATGSVTLFKVVTETTSIDTASVPDTQFAVPEGYTPVSVSP